MRMSRLARSIPTRLRNDQAQPQACETGFLLRDIGEPLGLKQPPEASAYAVHEVVAGHGERRPCARGGRGAVVGQHT
jgi:hypothetical protein